MREGPVGDQGDGPYSAGRGGAGNIAKDATAAGTIGDAEVIPETAIREPKNENFHYGRGGAGNEIHHKQKEEGEKVHKESLVDKIKDVFHK